jgi:hypothetical protein
MLAASSIFGVQVGSTAPAFLAILAVHAPAGTIAVISGAGAALTRKGSARHVRFGRRYYAAIAVVFVTGGALAALRWREDGYLVALGALAFAAATLGYLHRRRHRSGDTGHIVGMGASYAVLLTAFYVDNGPHLPLVDHLPWVVFWILPSAIAAVLILRALLHARSTRPPAPEQTPDTVAARNG